MRIGSRMAASLALAAALAAGAEALVRAPAAARADADGTALVKKMIDRHTPQDEQGRMTWRIVAKDGGEKRLRLTYRVKRAEGGREMGLLRFIEPREVRRTGLLTVRGGGKPDAQWVYLPDLKKTKRVAAGDSAERFMGSTFSYEDLRPEALEAHEYRILRREALGADPCDVVEVVPTAARAPETAYARRLLWIRAADAVPLKTQFFGKDGAAWKTLTASEIAAKDGFIRPDRLEMADEREGARTIVTVDERKINAGIADRVFSEHELEEGD